MEEIKANPLQSVYEGLAAKNPQLKELGFESFKADMKDLGKLQTLYEGLSSKNPQLKDRGFDGFRTDMFGDAQQEASQPLTYMQKELRQKFPENYKENNDDSKFQNWWNTNPDVVAWRNEFKKEYGEEPQQDGDYDYRGAFEAGITPTPNKEDGGKRHWDSLGLNGKDLKSVNHPTRWKSEYMKATEINPDEKGIDFESAVNEMPWLEKYRPKEQPKEEEQGFLDKLGSTVGNSFMTGMNNLNSWAADAPGFIYDLAGAPFRAMGLDVPTSQDFKDTPLQGISNFYKDNAKAYEQKVQQANPARGNGVIQSFQNGDIEGGILNLAGGIAESAPASIAMMLSGGATAPTILGGAAVFGAGKAQEMDENAPEMDYDKRRVIAALNGTLEGIFETYLGSGAVGKSLAGIIKNEGKDIAKDQVKRSLSTSFADMITKNPWLAPLGEGFEEVGTQISQNFVDKYSGYKPELSLTDGVGDAFLSGVGMGGIHGSVIGLAKKAMEDNQQTQPKTPGQLPDSTPQFTVNPRDTKAAELRQQAEQFASKTSGNIQTVEIITMEGTENIPGFVTGSFQQTDPDGKVKTFYNIREVNNPNITHNTTSEFVKEVGEQSIDDFVNAQMGVYDQTTQQQELLKKNQVQINGVPYILTGDQTNEGYVAVNPEDGSDIVVPANTVDNIRNSGQENANVVTQNYGKTQVTGIKNEDGSLSITDPATEEQANSLKSEVEAATGGKATVQAQLIPNEDATLPQAFQLTIIPVDRKGVTEMPENINSEVSLPENNQIDTSTPSGDNGLTQNEQETTGPADKLFSQPTERKVITQTIGKDQIDFVEGEEFDEVVPTDKMPLEKALPILEKKFNDHPKVVVVAEKVQVEVPGKVIKGETKWDDDVVEPSTTKTVIKSIKIVPKEVIDRQKQADTDILLDILDEFNATPQSREDKQQASEIGAIAKKLGYQTERTPMNEIRLFDNSGTISKPKVSQKSNFENANSEKVPESSKQESVNQFDTLFENENNLQKEKLKNEYYEKVTQPIAGIVADQGENTPSQEQGQAVNEGLEENVVEVKPLQTVTGSNNITSTDQPVVESLTADPVAEQIEQQEINLNPTEAQKEAGNYKKGHVKIQGMDITIENPKGSIRKGVDEDGKAWENVLQSHYGYFKRTIGKDNDHIDTFIGDNPESDMIFVVDQNSPKTGKFDESKVMTGFNSVEEAKAAYLANYQPDWQGFRSITAVPVDQFKEWLLDGAKQHKPFSEYKDTPNPVEQITPDGKPVPQEVLNDYPELKKEQALPRDVTGSKSQTTILIPKGSRVVDKRNPKAEMFFESVEGNNVVVATIFSDRGKKRQGEIDIPLDEFLENFIEVTESGYKKIKSQVNQYEKAQPIRLGGLTEKEQLQKERDLLNIAESNKKEAVKSPLLKVLEEGKKAVEEKKQSEISEIDAHNRIVESLGGKRNIWYPNLKQSKLTKLLGQDNLSVNDIELLKDFEYALLTDKQWAVENRFMTELVVSQQGKAFVFKDKFILTNIQNKLNEVEKQSTPPPEIQPIKPILQLLEEKHSKVNNPESAYSEGDNVSFTFADGSDHTGVIQSIEGGKIKIKADGKNYTVKESQIIGKENEIQFRISDNAEDNNLVAVHNIKPEGLLNADRLGGLPMPSIAIVDVNNGFVSYGEITLIADKDFVDPKKNKSAKVFASDVYSARYPSISHELPKQGNSKLIKKVNEVVPEEMVGAVMNGIKNAIDDGGLSKLNYSDSAKVLFLSDTQKPLEIKYSESKIPESIQKIFIDNGWKNLEYFEVVDNNDIKKQLTDLYFEKDGADKEVRRFLSEDGFLNGNLMRNFINDVKESIRSKGKVDTYATRRAADNYVRENNLQDEFESYIRKLYNELGVEEKIYRGYSNSGNRLYSPHTLSNVLKEMKKSGIRGGENFGYGAGNIRAKVTPEFKNISQIKENRDRITQFDDDIKDSANQELIDVMDAIKPFYKFDSGSFGYYDNNSDELVTLARSGRSESFKQLDEESRKMVIDFLNKLANMPTEYFEAKINRGVSLAEFKNALIPEDSSQEIRDILRFNGINAVEYKDNADRTEKLKQVTEEQNVRFRILGETGAANLDKAEEATTRLDNLAVAREMEGEPEATEEEFDDAALNLTTLDLEDDQVRYPKTEGKDSTFIDGGSDYNLYIIDKEKIPEAGPFEISIENDEGDQIGFIRATTSNKTISINLIHIKEDFRGNGIGTDIYEKLLNNGYTLKSDKEITDSTYSVYNRLSKYGYKRLVFPDGRVGLKKKLTPQQIRLATGWEKGVDGKWRYEVDDSDITFKQDAIDELKNNQKLANKVHTFSNMNYRKNEDGSYDFSMMKKGATSTSEFATYRNIPDADLEYIFDNNTELISKIRNGEGEEGFIGANMDEAKEIHMDFEHYVDGGATLGSLIENKEVFKSYPQLKKVVVVFNPESKSEGSFGKDLDGQDVITVKSVSGARFKSTLLHEVQHFIQEIEGFAKGGSQSMFKGERSAYIDRLQAAKNALYIIKSENKEQAKQELEALGLTNENISNLTDDYIRIYPELTIKSIIQTEEGILNPFNSYKRLAGEVESRNVQTRMNMTPEERRNVLLSETEDVAREDQIVLMDGFGVSNFEGENVKFSIDYLKSNDPLNKQVHYKSKKDIITYLEENPDKFSQNTINNVKKTDFHAIQIDDEMFINSDVSRSNEEVVTDWVHERFHVQLFENIPNTKRLNEILDSLYEKLGESEIRRIVPRPYWNNTHPSQANEYLAHAAQELAVSGKLDESIPTEVQDIITNIVNQFTTIKTIQDAKDNRVNLSNRKESRGNENASSGDGREVRPNTSPDGRKENNTNTSLRSLEGKGIDRSVPLTDYLSQAKQSVLAKKSDVSFGEKPNDMTNKLISKNEWEGNPIKIINENSDNSIVLYHGSANKITKLKDEKPIYFTPSIQDANNYILMQGYSEEGEFGYLYKIKLPLNNIEIVDDIDSRNNKTKKLFSEESKYFRIDNASEYELEEVSQEEINKKWDGDKIEIITKSQPENTIIINGVPKPTLNSNGKPIAATEEGIRNFWKWFGESRVTDAKGRPLVVYHGTNKEFDTFKSTKFPTAGYFSEDIAYAKSFAKVSTRYRKGKENVISVYLSISNPIDFSTYPGDKEYSSVELKGMFDIFKDKNIDWRIRRLWEWAGEDDIIDIIKNAGHDGITFNEMTVDFWKENDFDNDMADLKTTKSHIAFESNQIKSATGNNGSFSPDDNNINFKKEVREPLDTFLANAAEQYKEKQKTRRNFAEVKEKVREFIQDHDLPIRRLEELVKKGGGVIKDNMKPYRDMSNSYGRNETLYKNFSKDKMEPVIKTISKIIKSGVSGIEVLPYMISKHAIERNSYMREKEFSEWEENAKVELQKWTDVNVDIPQKTKDRKVKEFNDQVQAKRAELQKKDYSGVKGFDPENKFENPDELAQNIVDEFEAKVDPKLIDELWENTKEASSDIVNFWKAGQTMSAEQAKETKDRFKYFIPLRGWREGAAKQLAYRKGEGFSNSLQRAKGRTSFAENPLAYLQQTAFKAIGEQVDNEVKTSLLNLVTGNYDSQFQKYYKLKKAYYVKVNLPDGTFEWEMTMERPSEEMFASGDAKTKIYDQYQKLRTPSQAHEHEIYIKRPNGDMIVVMSDEMLPVAQAMNHKNTMYRNLFTGQINDAEFWNKPLSATFGVLNNSLKAMYTAWNVVFPLTNFARDIQEASITQFIKGDSGHMVLANYKNAFPAIIRDLRGKTPTGKYGMMLQEFRSVGGNTGFTHLKTPEQLEKEIKADLNIINRKGTFRGYTLDQLIKVKGGIEAWNQVFEDATRFSVYITSRENGKSIGDAAGDAKEASVNFNRKGKSSKAFDSIWAFWNVAIQSMQKNVKLAKDHPGRFGIVAGSWLALGLLEAMFNDWAGGDDDEDYFNISEYVRENYLIIPNLPALISGEKSDKYLRIPLPQFWRGFKSAGSLAYDVMNGKMDVLSATGKGLSNFMGGMLPIDMGGFIQDGEFSFAPLVPTIYKPLYEVSSNRDYMGFKIAKEPFTKEQKARLADSGLGKDNVSPAIKFCTDWLFRAGGGDNENRFYTKDGVIKQVPGFLDINPSVIEHVFEGYSGGTGQFLNNTFKTGMQAINPDTEVDFKNAPFLNSFFKKIPEAKWKIIGEYYDLKSDGNESKFDAVKSSYMKKDDKTKFIELATSGYYNEFNATLDAYDEQLTQKMKFMDYKTAEGSEEVINTMKDAIKAIKEVKQKYNRK